MIGYIVPSAAFNALSGTKVVDVESDAESDVGSDVESDVITVVGNM